MNDTIHRYGETKGTRKLSYFLFRDEAAFLGLLLFFSLLKLLLKNERAGILKIAFVNIFPLTHIDFTKLFVGGFWDLGTLFLLRYLSSRIYYYLY